MVLVPTLSLGTRTPGIHRPHRPGGRDEDVEKQDVADHLAGVGQIVVEIVEGGEQRPDHQGAEVRPAADQEQKRRDSQDEDGNAQRDRIGFPGQEEPIQIEGGGHVGEIGRASCRERV